ncbi:hypothetical protein SERLADRAFT_441228 [Serpula lacrymans var. lacrymans S7.9]|uniref:Shugoshin C-terminal domain-containing protein n=1 Tax=Serpula lacrymans var. lacrymans (strain S7.9) TaxID=578457 RepID=F8P5W3_SERL9|nr:uncharacterized protein SERLADRAFT_441228 [Serpula lacrymans var. lacrymans S7.9]EGO22000.1 hypothetical protein SERLADRAFT_441228 [Serpula lacrymans var. lacrymans S7.9]
MSRREPRVSLNIRQNDALNEFENCMFTSSVARLIVNFLRWLPVKKKFLLANKHITKLNSTLSVRIEELNAQISTLYVENLRLRASEIALTAQLKKEREKSRKVMADTETATISLTKHLHLLRQSFNIPSGHSPPPSDPPPPQARRPNIDPHASPQVPRLSRAPTIPGIYEEEEIGSSLEADEEDMSSIPNLGPPRKAKARLSASRLPLPARVASPPPLPTPLHINLQEQVVTGKKKSARRRSGLLKSTTDASGVDADDICETLIPPRPASPAFGSPVRREAGLAEENEEKLVAHDILADEDQDEVISLPRKEKKEKKSKLKERDVEGEASESERGRERERKRRREEEYGSAAEGSKFKLKDVTNSPRSRALLPPLDINTSDRDRQRTPETEGPTPISAATSLATTRTFLSTPATTPATTPQVSYLPTPRSSSSPIPPQNSTSSEADANAASGRERRARRSVNYAEPKLNTKLRKPDTTLGLSTASSSKKRSSVASLTDGPEPRSSLEGPLQTRGSPPVSRTSSSSSSGTNPLTTSTVKRKKSRPHVFTEDDEESEGTQADAEYGSLSGWVTIDGRRRSGNHHSARAIEADEGRRHSMAV